MDLPGSERLAEDPEILRLREGPILNRALHAFGATLRSLAEGPGGGLAPAAAAAKAASAAAAMARYGGPSLAPAAVAAAAVKAAASAGGTLSAAAAGSGVPFVDYEASALTKLLAGKMRLEEDAGRSQDQKKAMIMQDVKPSKVQRQIGGWGDTPLKWLTSG